MQTHDSKRFVPRMPWTRAPEMEHRFGRRLPCGTRVALSAGEGIVGAGRLRNVSLSGAFVETALELPLFGVVAIEKNREGERGIELLAWVVRRDIEGVGVEWCETPTCAICQMFGCPQPCHSGSGD